MQVYPALLERLKPFCNLEERDVDMNRQKMSIDEFVELVHSLYAAEKKEKLCHLRMLLCYVKVGSYDLEWYLQGNATTAGIDTENYTSIYATRYHSPHEQDVYTVRRDNVPEHLLAVLDDLYPNIFRPNAVN